MHVSQFSFSGGQINRGLIGRRDFAKYYSSAFLIENFVVRRHGTLAKRNGFTRGSVFSNTDLNIVRVIPFAKDNKTCDYVGFSPGKIAVFGMDGVRKSLLQSTGYDTYDTIQSLEYVQSGDVIFIASRDVKPKRIVRNGDAYALEDIVFDTMDTAHKPTLTLDTTNWTKADASKTRTIHYRVGEVVGGKEVRASVPVAVSVPFPPAQGSFTKISITRSDTDEDFEGFNVYRNDGSGWGYIGTTVNAGFDVEDAEAGQTLQLTPAVSGTVASGTFASDGSSRRPNTLRIQFMGEATPIKVVLAVTMDDQTYKSTLEYPGKSPTFNFSGFFTQAKNASIVVTATVTSPSGENALSPAPNFELGYDLVSAGSVDGKNAFTDDYIQLDYSQSIPTYRQPFSGAGNYPGVVCLYQQRMIWASTYKNPSMFWMSVPGDLNNFSVHQNIQDDDSINAALPLTRGPRILHAVAHKALLMFCESSECVVQARGDGALSYKTVASEQQSYTGSSERVRPLLCGNAVLFCDRAGSSVREYKYDYSLDAMSGRDISVLNSEAISQHGGIVDWTYAMFPDSVVWCVMGDGTLALLTYMPEQDVYAWASATLPYGYKATSIACGDALQEGTNGCTSAMLLVATDIEGRSNILVSDPTSHKDVFAKTEIYPVVGVVETVVPDSGGQIEPVRKRLITAQIRGTNLAHLRILSIDSDGETEGTTLPVVRNRRVDGEIAQSQLRSDWFIDPRLRIEDNGEIGTELLNATVTLETSSNI